MAVFLPWIPQTVNNIMISDPDTTGADHHLGAPSMLANARGLHASSESRIQTTQATLEALKGYDSSGLTGSNLI